MELSSIAVRALAALLKRHTGQQIAAGRQWRVETALKPLMREENITTLDRLVGLIAQDADGSLAIRTVEALLNHETSFFRDLAAFRHLTGDALTHIAARRAPIRRLRLWSAGCATGQEAYSIALRFAAEPDRWAGWAIDVLGTDVSSAAVERARAGLFTQLEIQRGLPIGDMMQHFAPEGDLWRASPQLRARVHFLRHNLLDPPPSTRFDIVLCRNVLLYFDPETAGRLFARLAEAIAPDGLLMLGAGETVIGLTDRFAADRELRGLYRPATHLQG